MSVTYETLTKLSSRVAVLFDNLHSCYDCEGDTVLGFHLSHPEAGIPVVFALCIVCADHREDCDGEISRMHAEQHYHMTGKDIPA